MPENPYAQYKKPNPYAVFTTPGTGPKPPSGFQSAPGGLAPIAGGPGDIGYATRLAGAKAQAEAAASAARAKDVAAYQAQLEIQTNRAKQLQNSAITPRMTPEVRKTTIDAFNAAKLLDTQIKDIESKYTAGPGATKGAHGLADYLPYTDNVRFDKAGDAVRGAVGQALNFTGGQLNTPREAEAAIGPFLPHANDRDQVILDKVQRLKDLRDKAAHQAIQTLGGVPDDQGNILPIDQAHKAGLIPGAPPPPPDDGTPKYLGSDQPPPGLATGKTRNVRDPKSSAVIDAIVRGGGSLDDVNSYVSSLGNTPITQEQFDTAKALVAKGYKGPLSDVTRSEGNGAFNRIAASPAGAYSIAAADAISAGNIDSAYGMLGGDPEDARAKMAAVAQANPKANLMGGITGAGLAAAGTEIGMGGLATRLPGIAGRVLGSARTADGLYGTAYGAGSNDDDRLTGALLGGTTGTVGGMFGRGLARGAGRAARGVGDEAVRYLHDAGVPLTVGQALGQSGRIGNVARTIENGMSSIPIVGDMIKARQREGFQGLNSAAFDQGLAPIGGGTNGVIGPEGVDLARGARSQAYRDTLDPVTLARDQGFTADELAARNMGQALPADMAQRADYAINRAGENFSPQDELTGAGFQQALRRFRRTASQNAPLPNGDDIGEVMNNAQGAYEGLLARQSPGTLPQYRAANEANRNVEILRNAVHAARNGTRSGETGTFTASQLNDAAAANAKRFGGTHGTPQQPFYELARAGQQVLPSTVPDSGTAGRLASLALPALFTGAGSGVGAATGDTGEGAKYGLALGALGSLGGSRVAQRAMVRALMDRPDWAERMSQELARRSPYVGMAFSGLGSSLSPNFVPSQ